MTNEIDYVEKPCIIRHGEYAIPVIPFKKIEEGKDSKKREVQSLIYLEGDSTKTIPLIFPRSLMVVALDQDKTNLKEEFYTPLEEALDLLEINNIGKIIRE